VLGLAREFVAFDPRDVRTPNLSDHATQPQLYQLGAIPSLLPHCLPAQFSRYLSSLTKNNSFGQVFAFGKFQAD
jgi:hypothetical protein